MDIKFKDNSKLRPRYTQLDYIESTGTQWIDTGFIPDKNSRYVITFEYTTLPNTWSSPMSGRDGTATTSNAFGVYITNNNKARISSGQDVGLIINDTILTNTLYTIDVNIKTGAVLYNNVNYTEGPYNRDGTKSIYIFAANDNGTASYKSSVRIYSIKFYKNDILIHDFVAALDNNSTPCMYDTVSRTFFYNQGTDNFVAGTVVSSAVGILPNTILLKTTTLYHKNCPNIDGYNTLKSIVNYSLNNQPEIKYNFYKDSTLWNSIKTAYPNLIPYTDACHEMLCDICTCITPGPVQLASDCNDIINNLTILEYIESTGTQYIQTNFSLNLSNKVFCKIKENVHNSNEGVPFAATWENNKMFYLQYGNNIKFCYFNNSYTMQSIDTNVHEFTLNDNGKYYIDGVEKGTVTQQNINLQNFRIFDIYVPNSSTNFKFTGRIYFIEIYDGATLLHNFIPVKDNNNVVCMYDTISQTFFYNQGTGDFVAGPEISLVGKNITDYVLDCTYDETPIILLNRVRVDIGNVSGSLSDLLQYAGMAGFNDNYEPQSKPRLVGTWTINSYYTSAQLAEAQATFDGLTIVGDPNYVLDFSQMAVQVLDPNEDNYNPAVAIILQVQNVGTTMASAPLGHGRWFLTKTQAAAITDISNWFYNKSTLTDTYGIVSTDVTQSYDFESFDEFEHFGVTYLGISNNNQSAFCNCSKLQSIKLPNTCSVIKNSFHNCGVLKTVKMPNSFIFDTSHNANSIFYNCYSLETIDISGETGGIIPGYCFYNCHKLKNITLSTNITAIYPMAFCEVGKNATFDEGDEWELDLPNLTSNFGNGSTFQNCRTLTSIKSLGSITSIPYRNQFYGCSRLKTVILPETLTTLDSGAFYYCGNLETINLPNSLTTISGAFSLCSKLKLTSVPSSITQLGGGAFWNVGSNATFSENELIVVNLPNLQTLSSEGNFQNCKGIKELRLGKITTFPYRNQINGCSHLKLLELPDTLTTIENGAFSYTDPQNMILHILAETPPSVPTGQYIPTKTYVGDGSSAAHDDAILADYLADTNWATYSSRLDTWYNYLHPQS